jgi:hypothetical protein
MPQQPRDGAQAEDMYGRPTGERHEEQGAPAHEQRQAQPLPEADPDDRRAPAASGEAAGEAPAAPRGTPEGP